MSVRVLLNLLNRLGTKEKAEACRAFCLFFTLSLINSIIQEHDHMTSRIFCNLISA